MKKKQVIQAQAEPTASVSNYKPDAYTLFLSDLYFEKNTPKTPDAPAVLNSKGIPYELAILIEQKIKSVMASQNRYNDFMTYLLTPSV